MKKIIAIAAAAVCAVSAFAGGIDNKSNLSTGYYRNPSHNTEHRNPDAVFYNIAGTAFMEDGLYFDVGNQFVFKEYSNEANGTTYKDTKNIYLYPNAEIVYKKDRFAFFGGFSVFAGGGELDYTDGTAATASVLAKNGLTGAASDHSLNVYSVTFGEIFGASYKINDNVSVSAAGRLLEGNQTLSLKTSDPTFSVANGSDEVGYKASGIGFGGIFGVHVKPFDGLDLSAQYQTITKLDFKFNTLTGSLTSAMLGVSEGDKFHNDLPAVLNLGAGYQLLEQLYINASLNYYFNEQADMDNVLAKTAYDYDNSWEAGAGAEYKVNETVTASMGFMYSKQGSNDSSNNVFSPVLNSITIGTGAEIKAIKTLTVSAGMLYSKYFEKTYQTIDLNKKGLLFSLGVTFKPL